MANICSFRMVVRGRRADVEAFYNALSQKGSIWIGRGAECELCFEGEEDRAVLDGWCKWSVKASLEYNAISMRQEPEKWCFGEDIDRDSLEILTLQEACNKWHLDVEVFAEESGCAFQEHIFILDGEEVCNESTDYYEYWVDDFKTKDEAEQELGISITDEEWESGDSYICRGGYDWCFEI